MKPKHTAKRLLPITIAALAALSLAACGKPGTTGKSGTSASTSAPAAKSNLSRMEKSALGQHDMTGWQRDKMAGLGRTVSGKQIVVEESGQGYTYRIHRFEDGKYAATTTHRFLSKDYADRFEQDKENYLGLSAAEADKGRLYIRYEDGNWGQYRNKTWQEVYGILKAQITESAAAAAKYNLPASKRLVE